MAGFCAFDEAVNQPGPLRSGLRWFRGFSNGPHMITMVAFTRASMKLPNYLTTAAIAAFCIAAPAETLAQTMKPGLWEITTQMQGAAGGKLDTAMAEMKKEMAGMSPEQRKMVEEMMTKQGVKVGGAGGGGVKVKVCMTQEMVDRNEIGARQQGDCAHTRSPRSGNTMKFSFVCSKPPSKGEGEVTFKSAQAYSMKMTSTSTIQGKPESMEMQGSGTWLSTDCGKVKPIAMPK